jgi:hypothetical protein
MALLSWLRHTLKPHRPAGRIAVCHLIALPNHLTVPVCMHDLCARSLNLVSEDVIENGSFLALTLEGTQGFSRFIRACVVHATQRPGGDWLVNCEFMQQLTGEELTALL